MGGAVERRRKHIKYHMHAQETKNSAEYTGFRYQIIVIYGPPFKILLDLLYNVFFFFFFFTGGS